MQKTTFGSWLKQQRKTLGLTGSELARQAHCSVVSIRKIESDDLTPSVGLARELARTLKIPATETEAFVRFARGNGEPVTLTRDIEIPPWRMERRTYPLPAPLTSLVGREREIQAVRDLLRKPGTRLLTLLGPPGVGKTRLALALAHAVEADFADGVCFVPLAPLTDPTRVLNGVAEALGVRQIGNEELLTTTRNFLRDKQMLLVLDNFEQVLEAAPLVRGFLESAPALQIVVTSRATLKIYGEFEIPVAPLSIPDIHYKYEADLLRMFAAVELFVERAQAVNTTFTLDNENGMAVAQICAWLDGLPLAIEMAAARVKWETPQKLFPHLARRLESLTGGPRDLSSRQQTLRGAIDWSYDLLNEPERRVLRQLGVFRGGFSAEAANAVCEFWVEVLLESLVEKSLVKIESDESGAARYALLEMIREYALEQLVTEGQAEVARANHAAFFRARAHAIWQSRQDPARGGWQRFDTRDMENYRAAMQWWGENDPTNALELAADLYDLWAETASTQEGRTWFRTLLPRSEASPHLARALNTEAHLALLEGDLDGAIALAERARVSAGAAALPAEFAFALHTLGRVAIVRSDYARAGEILLDARARFQALGMRDREANVLDSLGVISKDRGDLAQAEQYHSDALELRRALGLEGAIAYSLLNLATVAYWQGQYARAVELASEARARYLAEGNHLRTGYALDAMGMAQFKLNDLKAADESLRASLMHVRQVGDKRGMAMVLNDMGDLARAQGDLELARRHYRDALTLCRETGEKRRTAFCLEALAALMALQNETKRAAELLGAAAVLRQAIGTPLYDADLSAYQETVTRLRSQLGAEEYARSYELGQSLTMTDAIGLALAHPHGDRSSRSANASLV